MRNTKSQCTSIVGQMAVDVCLTQVCQCPPWSTLVTKFHPGPPLSTLVYPGLPNSTQFYPGLPRITMVRPRRRSASRLGQGWRVLAVLQFFNVTIVINVSTLRGCKRMITLCKEKHALRDNCGRGGEAATWMMSLLFVQLNSAHPPTQLFN